MSANTKIILVVIIFLLLLFAFVMPAALHFFELNLTAHTNNHDFSGGRLTATSRMVHATSSGSAGFFSGTGKSRICLEEV